MQAGEHLQTLQCSRLPTVACDFCACADRWATRSVYRCIGVFPQSCADRWGPPPVGLSVYRCILIFRPPPPPCGRTAFVDPKTFPPPLPTACTHPNSDPCSATANRAGHSYHTIPQDASPQSHSASTRRALSPRLTQSMSAQPHVMAGLK